LVGKAVDEMKDQERAEERQNRLVTPLPRRAQGVALGRPSPAAPAWSALIVILVVGIGLFALSEFLTPAGAWRAITGSLMVALMFGAMAAWVRANRSALSQNDERACEGSLLEIRYVASERYPSWRAEARGHRRERVRRIGARQDPPGPERS
jgi:hypothetical protein